eukprot:5999799-Prymnesium_polylepis.1
MPIGKYSQRGQPAAAVCATGQLPCDGRTPLVTLLRCRISWVVAATAAGSNTLTLWHLPAQLREIIRSSSEVFEFICSFGATTADHELKRFSPIVKLGRRRRRRRLDFLARLSTGVCRLCGRFKQLGTRAPPKV